MIDRSQLLSPANRWLLVAALCFTGACASLRAYVPGSSGPEPFETSIDDASKDTVEADSVELPKKIHPIEKQQRAANGGYDLKPGAYEQELDSFCMYPGKASAGKGTAYLPAPYKGPKAAVLRSIITRWRAFPDKIGKSDAQQLLWAILTKTKIKDASPTVRKAASALLAQSDIDAIDGASLAVLNETAMNRVMQQIPPELRDAYRKQNELRAKFADASASYDELEKIAVPPAEDPGQSLGTWTKMPAGHLIRYLPSGYQQVRVQIVVPKAAAFLNLDPFRLDTVLAQGAPGGGVNVDPSDQVATPTSGQRLGMSPPAGGPAENSAVASGGSGSGGSSAASSGSSSSGEGGSTAGGDAAASGGAAGGSGGTDTAAAGGAGAGGAAAAGKEEAKVCGAGSKWAWFPKIEKSTLASYRTGVAGTIDSDPDPGKCNVQSDSIGPKIFVHSNQTLRPDRMWANKTHYYNLVDGLVIDGALFQFFNIKPGFKGHVLVARQDQLAGVLDTLIAQCGIRKGSGVEQAKNGTELRNLIYGNPPSAPAVVRNNGADIQMKPSGKAARYLE